MPFGVVGEPKDWENEDGMDVGGERVWRADRLGRAVAVVGDVGGEKAAPTGEVGIALDMRFVVDSDRPAFSRDRMRSAMLPPPVLTMAPSPSSSVLDDLQDRFSREPA